MRDRLIELIGKAIFEEGAYSSDGKLIEKYPVRAVAIELVQPLADYLIFNGVTFAPDKNVGCKYCEEYADLPEHFVDGKPVGRVFDTCIQHDGVSWHLEPASGCDIGIMFCPMCGRLLPEPPKEGKPK